MNTLLTLLCLSSTLAMADDAAMPSLQQLFDRAQYQQVLQHSHAKHDADSMALRVQSLIQQQQRDEAQNLLDAALLQFPQQSELYYLSGINLIALAGTGSVFNARGRATRGIEMLQQAINIDPGHFAAQQALIQFYLVAPASAGGSEELARQHIAQLTEIDVAQGVLAEVQLLLHENQMAKAVKLLDKQLQLTPLHPELLMRRGALLSRQNIFQLALDDFQQVIQLDVPVAQRYQALFQIGRLAVLSETDYIAGISALTEYLTFFADSEQSRLPWARLRLVQLLLLTDNHAAAKHWFTDSPLRPDDADYTALHQQLQSQLQLQ
ncbi:hypothetical protein [Arsukibacterium sp.]|uniref:hypothetical protein n=1 Tax=Arsukibacterium sp. TaxID=1977258 RepID=UPI002FDAFFE5